MSDFKDIIKKNNFFKDLREDYIDLLSGCCFYLSSQPNQIIKHEGDDAENFYLIREGKIAIQIHSPEYGPITLQTLAVNDVVGWSWLFSDYKWHFDIVSLDITRLIGINGKCLREKCEKNHDLGYELIKKFSKLIIDRLQATTIQLLDVYKDIRNT